MMRKLTVLPIFLTAFSVANACDICGCGVSNYNPFLFPHLSKNYLGISWVSRHYVTYGDDGSTAREYYNSILITGQYNPFQKLQVSVMVPWQLNKMENLDGQKNISGLGDITALANYRVLDKTNSPLRHTLVAGLGIKLPTGKYTPVKGEKVEGQNFQAGTGSVDYLANASYHFGWRQWTFSLASTYKYNTQNKDEYRYGDVFTNGITAVYQKEFKNFSLSPYGQLINETLMMDAESHLLKKNSGGNVLYGGGGVDITTRNVSGGLNYQFVANQNIANGSIIAKPRFSVHLLINL